MKKFLSLIAASMFVSAVAFAQVPEQNQQQGTVPQQNQTTSPQQNQTPQPPITSPEQNQPPQSNPQRNQSTFPHQDEQGITPEPQPEQTISPQQQEQQGGFPQKDTTSPAISDTTQGSGMESDTSQTSKPPKW